MKKLLIPKYDLRLVKYLSSKPVEDQPRVWKQTGGRPGRFKRAVTEKLLEEQSRRCAYCGDRLIGDEPHRDHIAPKVDFPEWTFWPKNLVLACYSCNTGLKKTYNPVVLRGKSYKTTAFSIVHPYLDDPRQHIRFLGHRTEILIAAVNNSNKGKETIRIFDLASPDRTKQRAKDVLFDRDLAHLHGKWKLLFQQVITSPLPRRVIQVF